MREDRPKLLRIMFLNYLLTAWRRLRKNRGFFALNFFGLYIGVTAALLIALLIFFEAGVDRGGGTGPPRDPVGTEKKGGEGATPKSLRPYPPASALAACLPRARGRARGRRP